MQAGFYTMDALIAAAIMLLMIFTLLEWTASEIRIATEYTRRENLVFGAAALSEKIVKLRDSERPEQGSAWLDPLTKRIVPNHIDESLLIKIRPMKIGKNSLAAIYIRTTEETRYFFRKEKQPFPFSCNLFPFLGKTLQS